MFKFASKKDLNQEYKCTIRLLDDNEVLQTDFQKDHKGQYLLDYCFKNLNLMEKDYFGLRYVDTHKQRNWLDPTRSIIKQVKGLTPIIFCFRVKFYPADPTRLKEEITRYFHYLQLRRDLLHGRLYCSSTDAAPLMALIIQSELGDYDPEEHQEDYVSEFKLVMNQTAKLEANVMEIHQKEMRGQTPAQAELNFLKKAAALDTYGIDPHPVKDHKGSQLYLGVNYSGIITFQGSRKTHHFKWNEVQKITYEGRMFITHLIVNEKKHLIGFKCPSVGACHFLWRCAVEQRYFFTMNSSNDVPLVTTGGSLFSRGCKLRYSGRVEKEIFEDIKQIPRKEVKIHRSYSTTSAPPSMRTLDRSNLHKLPSQEQPDQERESPDKLSNSFHEKVVPYLNYSTSEPGDAPHSFATNTANTSFPPLDPFDEEEWDFSMTSSLPTEFDLRPDLTPTGEESHLLSFETPALRSSPSHVPTIGDTDAENFSDEVMDEMENRGKDRLFIGRNEATLNTGPGKCSSLEGRRMKPLDKVYVMVRTSILSSLLLLLLFSCLVILIIESESDLFAHLRKLPEMVVLRRDYYEPMKSSFFHVVGR